MQDVKINRNKFIGGSDIPVIMNISNFKKRFDLLLEKAEILKDEFQGNIYTSFGNEMEPQIRDYINTKYEEFKEDLIIEDNYRGHFDGINSGYVLEIKTTSKIFEKIEDYKAYLVQLLFYMKISKRKKGLLVVYNRPDDFNLILNEERIYIYEININDYKELVGEIFKSCELFLKDLDRVKSDPFITEEELLPVDIIKISNDIIKLENDLVKYDEIIKKRDKLKSNLKEIMEQQKIKKWETPNGTKITLVEDGVDKEILKFNEKNFKKENEELYKKYEEAKIQKGRKGYIKITLGD